MIELMLIGAIMAINMAKKTTKKPVFGQLTLTGELALDWLKSGVEIQVRKLWMGSTGIASEYNLPDWAKEKGVIAMLFPMDEWANPVLVTQKSVLRVLEAQCAEWEAKGAKCTMTRGKAEILFEENQPRMEFVRPEDGPTYAPYRVTITE
tara:strand:+ start:914 stop:1363 length:450 start_codon:yes stop_codon:yes gene_type:complete